MKRKNASINETQPSHNVDKQVFNVAGVLLQFLASPEEVGDAICLIRGTMPPGVVVPLHKHAEVELLYVLEGSLEFFMAKEGTQWATAGMGDVIAIPSNVKHALRNRSSLPVALVLVTKSHLYAFSGLAKTTIPNQRAPRTLKRCRNYLSRRKIRIWMASPDENAAIDRFVSKIAERAGTYVRVRFASSCLGAMQHEGQARRAQDAFSCGLGQNTGQREQ
jgi:quercetin dioxygenase-like cupin family protein